MRDTVFQPAQVQFHKLPPVCPSRVNGFKISTRETWKLGCSLTSLMMKINESDFKGDAVDWLDFVNLFRTPSGDETFGFHKFNRAVSLQHSNQRRQDLPCQFCCGSREVSVCWRKREQVLAEATGCARPPSNPRATTHCCRQAGHVSGHPGKAPFLTLASVPTPLHFKAQHFQEHLLASAGRELL